MVLLGTMEERVKVHMHLGWKTDVKLCDERKGHFCYLLSFVGYLHSVEDFFCLRVKFLLPKKH